MTNYEHPCFWRPRETAALEAAYVQKNLTAGEIARKRLIRGKSRDAILGKVRRMGLKHGGVA